MQEPKPLGPKLSVQGADTGDVAARAVQAGDKTDFDRIRPDTEDDGNCRGRSFCRECRRRAAGRGNQRHSAIYQIGHQFRQASVVIVPEPKFDCDIASFDKACFVQAFAECRDNTCTQLRHTRVDKSNDWHRRLLRARCERPCDCRTTEQPDELAPLHSITSSAVASSLSGICNPSALAATRLITRSNLVGCSTGISAGFAPRSTLSTNSAARRNRSGKFGPYDIKPPGSI